jgi:hypothetical protein
MCELRCKRSGLKRTSSTGATNDVRTAFPESDPGRTAPIFLVLTLS